MVSVLAIKESYQDTWPEEDHSNYRIKHTSKKRMNLQNIGELHVLGKNTFKKNGDILCCWKGGVVVRVVYVQSNIWKTWNHDLTVLSWCVRGPLSPRSSRHATEFPVCLAGYPSYFDLAPSKQERSVQWFKKKILLLISFSIYGWSISSYSSSTRLLVKD